MTLPIPSIPPGGSEDPALDPNWDGGPDNCGNNLNQQTAAQIILQQLEYIHNHPGYTQGYVALVDTVMRLSEKGLMSGSVAAKYLQEAMANDPASSGLLRDAIDQCADYAFLNGYGGQPAGSWAAVTAYLNTVKSALNGIHDQNPFIHDMLDEVTTIEGDETAFMQSHVAGTAGSSIPGFDAFGIAIASGDIVWNAEIDGKEVYFDWTKAEYNYKNGTAEEKAQAKAELNVINGTVGGASGPNGSSASNPDLMALGFNLPSIRIQNSHYTIDQVLKLSGGDVGLAILALLYSMEGGTMGTLSGNADVMDKQTGLSQDAKAIEDYLKTLASGGGDAGNLRGYLLSLFSSIENSSQFSGPLSDAVDNAVSTLNSTKIPYPAGADPTKPANMRSIWDLITDPTVKNSDLGDAMKAYFSAVPVPAPSTAPTNPTQELQSLLGGLDGIVTAVSSASSQATTIASQLESLIQAIVKPMLGVIDPNNGMNTAVIKSTINHQTGN